MRMWRNWQHQVWPRPVDDEGNARWRSGQNSLSNSEERILGTARVTRSAVKQHKTTKYADVAELADALVSGTSECTFMWVQVPSSAPNQKNPNQIFPIGKGFGFFVYVWFIYIILRNRGNRVAFKPSTRFSDVWITKLKAISLVRLPKHLLEYLLKIPVSFRALCHKSFL